MLRTRSLILLLACALVVTLAVWHFAAQAAPEVAAAPSATSGQDDHRERPAATDVLHAPESPVLERVNAASPQLATSDTGTLIVRVVDRAGDPIPEATVEASFRRQLHSQATRVELLTSDVERRRAEEPDDKGRFVIDGCVEGTWKVTADAPGFAPAEEFVSLDRERFGVRLELTRESVTAGHVVDANGIAIEGAIVRSSSVPEHSKLYPRGLRGNDAFTDRSGSFQFSFAGGGVFALTAKADGFVPNLPQVVTCDGPERIDHPALVLQRTSSIDGSVLDEAGLPDAAALVNLDTVATDPGTTGYFRTRTTSVDKSGHFRFDGLRAGQYLITICEPAPPSTPLNQVFYPQEKPQQLARITLSSGEQRRITLQDPGPGSIRLHGSVQSSGQPVTTGSVTFIPSRVDGLVNARIAEVADDGTYELTLHESGPGTLIHSSYHLPYRAWLESSSYRSASAFCIDVPDRPSFRCDIELPSGSISGVMVADRDPMSTMTRAVPTGGDALWSPDSSQSSITITLDGFGSPSERNADRLIERPFRVSGLSPGTWDVHFTSRPSSSTSAGTYAGLRGVVLGPGESVEGVRVRLRPACSLEFELRGDGFQAEDVRYTLRDDAGNTVQSERLSYAADGRYRITSVPIGELSLEVRTQSASCEPVDFTAQPGNANHVRLHLERTASLSVTTLEADGQPAMAIMRVFDSAGRECARSSALDAPLDLEGRSFEVHELGPLLPNRYRLIAIDPDGRQVEHELDWKAGDARVIELRFPAR